MNTPYENYFLEVLIVMTMFLKDNETPSRDHLVKAITYHNYLRGELSSLIDPPISERITR